MMRDASCIDEVCIFMHGLEILPLSKATFAPEHQCVYDAEPCVWCQGVLSVGVMNHPSLEDRSQGWLLLSPSFLSGTTLCF